jgi:hypothetical protein
MPSRLPYGLAVVLVGYLAAIPSPSIAQHHGPRAYGGGWHGGGGYGYRGGYAGIPAYGGYRTYGGYRGYGGYPAYYVYPGYYGHYNNGAWIAVGAGILGVMLGSVIARPYVYPYPPPVVYAPPAPVATQQCPDGSTIPAGSYCPAAPAPVAPPPVATPYPSPERG